MSEGTPKVVALLDWELCTLGHPLADLGYVCANCHADNLPTGQFKGLDFEAMGIPTEHVFLERPGFQRDRLTPWPKR